MFGEGVALATPLMGFLSRNCLEVFDAVYFSR
jgi:hypothetical protein